MPRPSARPAVHCEACLARLSDVERYRVGRPITVSRALNLAGHALYRHPQGAQSLCAAPPRTDNAEYLELERRLQLSQADVAALCGVSRRQVARWRNGPTPPPLYAVRLLQAEAELRRHAATGGPHRD